jgi:hypothetical protein
MSHDSIRRLPDPSLVLLAGSPHLYNAHTNISSIFPTIALRVLTTNLTLSLPTSSLRVPFRSAWPTLVLMSVRKSYISFLAREHVPV